MSTPKTEAGKPQLSDREMEILSKAWKCMKVQPEIDYTKLAGECGMTNVRSASNAWGSIKKKLFADLISTPPGSAKKRKAPATPADGNKTADGNSSDDDEPVETPTKKRARAKPKPKPAATVSPKTETSDTETVKVEVKTKKGGAKPKKENVMTKKEAKPKKEEDTDVKDESEDDKSKIKKQEAYSDDDKSKVKKQEDEDKEEDSDDSAGIMIVASRVANRHCWAY